MADATGTSTPGPATAKRKYMETCRQTFGRRFGDEILTGIDQRNFKRKASVMRPDLQYQNHKIRQAGFLNEATTSRLSHSSDAHENQRGIQQKLRDWMSLFKTGHGGKMGKPEAQQPALRKESSR